MLSMFRLPTKLLVNWITKGQIILTSLSEIKWRWDLFTMSVKERWTQPVQTDKNIVTIPNFTKSKYSCFLQAYFNTQMTCQDIIIRMYAQTSCLNNFLSFSLQLRYPQGDSGCYIPTFITLCLLVEHTYHNTTCSFWLQWTSMVSSFSSN